MKNPLVGRSEKQQIDLAVGRLLSEFRGLEPPLDLTKVRSKLRLDLEYYSSKDPGHLRQLVHSLKVAGLEVLNGPSLLGKIVRKLGLRAMLFMEDNRILIDKEQHSAKYRWAEGHEVAHKLIFWHKDFLLGDTKNELTPSCHSKIEAEANYGCGQLVFLQNRFVDEAMSYSPSIESVKTLKKKFGNSHTATLWRLVEEYRGPEPLVGIVSGHPRYPTEDFDITSPCNYVIQSSAFRAQFSQVSELEVYSRLRDVCSFRKGGSLANETATLTDDNGDDHEFLFDSFCFRYKQESQSNGYQVLTLGVQTRKLTPSSILVPSIVT